MATTSVSYTGTSSGYIENSGQSISFYLSGGGTIPANSTFSYATVVFSRVDTAAGNYPRTIYVSGSGYSGSFIANWASPSGTLTTKYNVTTNGYGGPSIPPANITLTCAYETWSGYSTTMTKFNGTVTMTCYYEEVYVPPVTYSISPPAYEGVYIGNTLISATTSRLDGTGVAYIKWDASTSYKSGSSVTTWYNVKRNGIIVSSKQTGLSYYESASSLVLGNTYYYEIEAINSQNTAYSVSYTGKAYYYYKQPLPEIPGDISSIYVNNSRENLIIPSSISLVTVSWTAATGAQSYDIEYDLNGTIQYASSNTTSYKISIPNTPGAYLKDIYVTGVNAGGYSPLSILWGWQVTINSPPNLSSDMTFQYVENRKNTIVPSGNDYTIKKSTYTNLQIVLPPGNDNDLGTSLYYTWSLFKTSETTPVLTGTGLTIDYEGPLYGGEEYYVTMSVSDGYETTPSSGETQLLSKIIISNESSSIPGRYDLTTDDISGITLKPGDILECAYTGNYIPVTLPPGGYSIELWGAQGGGNSEGLYGGRGAYLAASYFIPSTPQLIYLFVGGKGQNAFVDLTDQSSTITLNGGWNGGGKGGGGRGPSGGGATDLRTGLTEADRLFVAAGGGGSATSFYTNAKGRRLESTNVTSSGKGEDGIVGTVPSTVYYYDTCGGGGGLLGGKSIVADDADYAYGGISGINSTHAQAGNTLELFCYDGNTTMIQKDGYDADIGTKGNGFIRIYVEELVDRDYPVIRNVPLSLRLTKAIVGDIYLFPYTGKVQGVFLRPGRYFVELWGAQGGGNTDGNFGGPGAYISGEFEVSEMKEYSVVVGSKGIKAANQRDMSLGVGSDGGFENGGKGGGSCGPGGGGSSSIRLSTYGSDTIISAGGGGGSVSLSTLSKAAGRGDVNINVTANDRGGDGAYGNAGNAAFDTCGGGGGWLGGLSIALDDADYAYGGTTHASSSFSNVTIRAGYQIMPSADGDEYTGNQKAGYARITILRVGAPKAIQNKYCKIDNLWKNIKKIFIKTEDGWKLSTNFKIKTDRWR